MRVLFQWALAAPADWQAVDVRTSRNVRDLPRKPAPTGGEVVNAELGWLSAVSCQGIVFDGYDHVAVEAVGSGVRITGWQDDTADFGDTRWATSWLLLTPAPDPALGGRVNTVQARTVYATPDAAAWFPGVPVLPWAQFVAPPASQTFHGIWVSDELHDAHLAARTPRGWREWVT